MMYMIWCNVTHMRKMSINGKAPLPGTIVIDYSIYLVINVLYYPILGKQVINHSVFRFRILYSQTSLIICFRNNILLLAHLYKRQNT